MCEAFGVAGPRIAADERRASVRAATQSERRASLEKDDVQADPTAISGKADTAW